MRIIYIYILLYSTSLALSPSWPQHLHDEVGILAQALRGMGEAPGIAGDGLLHEGLVITLGLLSKAVYTSLDP